MTDTSECHFRACEYMVRSLDIEIERAFDEQLKGVGRRHYGHQSGAYGCRRNMEAHFLHQADVVYDQTKDIAIGEFLKTN